MRSSGRRMPTYVFCVLECGPRSGQGTADERKAMFAGHMGNINRLAQTRELLMAGPYDKPADTARRGVLVFDVAPLAEARQLAATHPGVIAGEFTPRLRRMTARTALRRSLDLYNEQQAAKAARTATDGTKPPQDMRKYVLVEGANAGTLTAAITGAGLSIVWQGYFLDEEGGIFAVDSTDAAGVRAALEARGVTSFDADGLWSTSALMRLRETQPAR